MVGYFFVVYLSYQTKIKNTMKNLSSFRKAISENRKFFWVDPQPIEGNNYLITSIEPIPIDITEQQIKDYPITIQYGYGSEAEVFLSEIKKVLSIEEYAKLIGYKGNDPTLEKIQTFAQDELDWTIWDYPIEEYGYVLTEVHDNSDELVFVDTEIGFRICEK